VPIILKKIFLRKINKKTPLKHCENKGKTIENFFGRFWFFNPFWEKD
jgi:hypothetical protein